MRNVAVVCLLAYFFCWDVSAQSSPTTLQHPGSICCNQILCPFLPLGQINEELPTTPTPSEINLEFAWFVLVDDTTAASGTKWVKIPNTNTLHYQPTQIMSQYGGFYMRGVRQVGTLPYLFSNVVNIKILSASNPDCASATGEAQTLAEVVLSPNPASDQLQVVVTSADAQISGYRVFGLDGQQYRQQVVDATNALTLQISDMRAGLYFLQLDFTDGKTWINKWVKY
jgi:hypothetical protein